MNAIDSVRTLRTSSRAERPSVHTSTSSVRTGWDTVEASARTEFCRLFPGRHHTRISMQMTKRVRGLLLLAIVMAASAFAPAHAAEPWRPQKPVELIAGVAAGAALDISARTAQKIWQEKRRI